MASQKSARRSRKRHSSAKTPRAVPSHRRERAQARDGAGSAARPVSSMSAYGERPPSPFGGLPVSEVAIFAGAVALVVGLTQSGGPALVVGVVVCVLGVLEITVREHFSGYRSHATLLAAMAAVAVETVLALFIVPGARAALLIVMVPVFAGVFALLRRRFTEARQARVRAMPPA
jgi:hypothetical protein